MAASSDDRYTRFNMPRFMDRMYAEEAALHAHANALIVENARRRRENPELREVTMAENARVIGRLFTHLDLIKESERMRNLYDPKNTEPWSEKESMMRAFIDKWGKDVDFD